MSITMFLVVPLAIKLQLSRAVPINFWLLQRSDQPLDVEVALCSAVCASEDAEALERNLAEVISRECVAVEIQPLQDDDDGVASMPLLSEGERPAPIILSDGTIAEELGLFEDGPRSFVMPGGQLARVREFDFKDGGTGCCVWDAAVGLSIWLTQHADVVRGKRCLELGSGVGLCGITAALMGASEVVLSDLDEQEASLRLAGGAARACSTARLLDNLDANARLNGVGKVARTMALDWEDCIAPQQLEDSRRTTYPIVIGSDLVYEGFAVSALAAAIEAYLAPDGAAYLLSARVRWEAASTPLVAALEAAGTVHTEPYTVHNSHGRTQCVLATFRKSSRRRARPMTMQHGLRGGAALTSLLGGAFGAYRAALTSAPITTNVVSAAALSLLADSTAQTVERRLAASPSSAAPAASHTAWDVRRSASIVVWGALVSGFSLYFWFGLLARLFPRAATSTAQLIGKVALNQLVMSPSLNAGFFTYVVFTRVEPPLRFTEAKRAILLEKLRRDLPTTIRRSCYFWSVCQTINFRLMPLVWQTLWTNACFLIWTTYLSWVGFRARRN
eukprot:jgi/Chrpa1/25897/Chrysochromulina_OHIO_Genome00011894-RA